MTTNNNISKPVAKPVTKSPDKIWSYNVPVGIDDSPEVESLWQSVVRLCGGKPDSAKTRNMWDRVMRMVYTLFSLCAVCYDRITNPCGDLILPGGNVMDSVSICDWLARKMYRYVSTADIKATSMLFNELVTCKIVQPSNDGTDSLCVPMWQSAQRFLVDNMRRQKQENDAWRAHARNNIYGEPSAQQEYGYRGYYRISHELDITNKEELKVLADWALNMAYTEQRIPITDEWLYYTHMRDYLNPADDNGNLDDVLGDGDGECYGDNE